MSSCQYTDLCPCSRCERMRDELISAICDGLQDCACERCDEMRAEVARLEAAEGDACPLCDGAAFDCPACGGPAELSEELRVAAARHELWLWAQEQKLGERWAAEMEAQSQCEHPGQALEDWQRIGAGWRARCGLCGEGVEI